MFSGIDVNLQTSADYIHDVSYNYFGDRIAVCSSAQRVLIYDRDEASDSQWVLSDVLENAHDAPIWRVDWAPPEFGQVLATCSEDRFLNIWAERSPETNYNRANTGPSAGTTTAPGALNGHAMNPQLYPRAVLRWSKVARLQDCRAAAVDVAFSPAFSSAGGLRVAVCSADGTVLIYESPGVNLSIWSLEDTLRCHPGFAPAPAEAAPAAASKNAPAPAKPAQEVPPPMTTSGQAQAGSGVRGCSALAWSRTSTVPGLAVVGMDGTLQLWMRTQGGGAAAGANKEGRQDGIAWALTSQVRAHTGACRDVAWAPNLCRSQELLATCGDRDVALWSMNVRASEGTQSLSDTTLTKLCVLSSGVPAAPGLLAAGLAALPTVWRVSFNLSGTTLAVASDDGSVSLWTQGEEEGVWAETATVAALGDAELGDEGVDTSYHMDETQHVHMNNMHHPHPHQQQYGAPQQNHYQQGYGSHPAYPVHDLGSHPFMQLGAHQQQGGYGQW